MKHLFIVFGLIFFSTYNIFSQCSYSIVLIDSWGDGWNGGQIEVTVAGISVGVYTIVNGNGPETHYFTVNNGEEIRCTYTAGGFPNENEYYIYDADGTEIFSDGIGNNAPVANDSLVGTGSCPSCPVPISVTTGNITASTVDLSWNIGTASEWEVEYGTTGFTQGTGTIITGINSVPYNLSGLTSNTTYDFYVRSICALGDTSSWQGPNSFTTECDAVMAPYFENFENSGNIPGCWSSTSTTGEVWKFNHQGGNDHGTTNDHTTGSGYFAWADDSENPPSSDITLLSPLIDVSGLSTPTLYFWRFSNDEGSGTNAILYVDVWDGSTWHDQFATYSGNTTLWQQEIIDLTSLTITGPVKIRFVVDEANGSYFDDICIDDIEITNFITCPQPTTLSLVNVTETSAEIGWVEVGSATTWNIQYGPAGFTPGNGTIINDVVTNPDTVTGLSPLVEYDFYVQAKCSSSDTSTWEGPLTLMTASTNPTPCEAGIPVPDGGCVDIPIIVSGFNDILGDNVLLNGVHYIMQHTYDADIVISLESPTGITDTLSQQHGGGGNDYGIIDGTCTQYTNFTMSASTPIASGTPPFVGDFIPDNDLNIFDGIDPNGTWILHLCDVWNVDQGTFEFAELDFQNVLPPAVVKINEIDVTQGNDTAEFVELYDGGFGNFPLDNMSLIFYDGAGDTVLTSLDLSGYSTDSNGYFVVGDTSVSNVQLILQDSIQDGCDAVVLYNDLATIHPVGSGISLNNIQDAVVYLTDDFFDLQLLALLNTGQPEINENVAGESNIQSLSRLPNGAGGTRNTQDYYVSIPTPGDSNLAIPSMVWNDSTFTENLILNDGSIENSISVKLVNDKFSQTGILTEGTDFYTTLIPSGLTTQINVLSDTVAEISLIGNALSHLDINDVYNATIAFKNNVFVYGDTVYNHSFKNDSLFINFSDFATPHINWDTTIFYENAANHGGIANSIHLHLTTTYFPQNSGVLADSIFYTTANVPQGLSVQISLSDSVNADISLIGNAVNHNNSDDIYNLSIHFLDTAFVGYNTSEVINSFNDSISVDFTLNPIVSVNYDTTTFYEDTINHGGIANTIHLHLGNTFFPIDSGILSDTVYYSTANIPQGLNMVISLIDSANAIIMLNGYAAYNNDSDDVNNLTIIFNDTAFMGFSATEVINSSYDSLKIDFNDGLSDSTEILTFSFPLETGPAIINHQNKTVTIEVNQYADLSYLIPTFTLSTGATATVSGIAQISGVTPNNYSNPLVYNVLAQDSVANTDWIVTVTQEMAIETNEIRQLKIYPNPANNFLIIESNKVPINNFTLLNSKEQIVYNRQVSSLENYYTIPLNTIPEGVFILKIDTKVNILYKKIIILK